MTNRVNNNDRIWVRAVLAASLLAGGAWLSACKEEAPPPPPPPPARQVAQPVDAQSFVSDPRVQFPQEHAPTNESVARAVGDLASALASGDAGAMLMLLDAPGRAIIEEQVDSGAWGRETTGIEVVRVVSLTHDNESVTVTLAVQDKRGAYLLGWKGVRGDDQRWVFGGAPSPDDRALRASELDGVVDTDTE